MKRHAQIVGLLLTVFMLGALVQQKPDAETQAEPESADAQQKRCRWCDRTDHKGRLQGGADVKWGENNPIYPEEHRWCNSCRNKYTRYKSAQAAADKTSQPQHCDEDTVMADQSLSPRGTSTTSANHSAAFAAQTAADSRSKIGSLTQKRQLEERARNLAQECSAAKKAKRREEAKNKALQHDNDALRKHINDLETAEGHATYLRNTSKANALFKKEGFTSGWHAVAKPLVYPSTMRSSPTPQKRISNLLFFDASFSIRFVLEDPTIMDDVAINVSNCSSSVVSCALISPDSPCRSPIAVQILNSRCCI
jgi:hypothetical protein